VTADRPEYDGQSRLALPGASHASGAPLTAQGSEGFGLAAQGKDHTATDGLNDGERQRDPCQ